MASFDEDLEKAIRRGGAVVEEEAGRRGAFREAWAVKLKKILAILGKAELTFKRIGIGGYAHRDNGNGGVMLEAGTGISSFRHNLRFTPNQNENRILCSATIADFVPKTFDLDALTDEAVEDAVKEFGELLGREKIDDSAAKLLAGRRQ